VIAIDLQELKAVVFDRMAVDAPGAPIRAMLPAGAAGIVDSLILATNRPAVPFLAIRRGPFITVERSIGSATFYWVIYDDPDNSYVDSNEMIKLIARAYNYELYPLTFNGAPLGVVDMFVGEEGRDPALLLLSTKITLTVYC
jgi:hypothetical protein